MGVAVQAAAEARAAAEQAARMSSSEDDIVIQAAKIQTLGERVEDVFFLTTSEGLRLGDDQATMTLAPAAAKVAHIGRPRPPAPPVTMTVLSCSEKFDMNGSFKACSHRAECLCDNGSMKQGNPRRATKQWYRGGSAWDSSHR